MNEETNPTIKSLLAEFIKNNPRAKLRLDEDNIRIESFWGEDWFFEFSVQDKKLIDALNKLTIVQEFDAIFVKRKKAEFFYGSIDPNNSTEKDLLGRKFEIYIEGGKCICEWKEPSPEYTIFAERIKRYPSSTNVHANQLHAFKHLSDKKDLPEELKEYFERQKPYNFTIKLPRDLGTLDLPSFFQHVNFCIKYYDRQSPSIQIREKAREEKSDEVKPIRYLEGHFPDKISIGKLDENCIKLLDVAQSSNPRQAFLYYYQIFEYAGYYYIEERMKKKIVGLLKDPALINCFDEKIDGLLTLFSDLNHADDAKMRKVIEECCDPSVIWKEVEPRKKILSTNFVFDGGFDLKALVSSDITEETWHAMWMPKVFDSFTKIRNCLVHARERRENKVILPTESNTEKLTHFIPIIRRMAEQIAIKTSV
jgi:hypothetical protein